MHEGGGGEIGFGWQGGGEQWGHAAPEVEWVREFLEPDFFGEEDLRLQRCVGAEAGIAPADELAVLDDVLEAGGMPLTA